jgi:hypothetical protein
MEPDTSTTIWNKKLFSNRHDNTIEEFSALNMIHKIGRAHKKKRSRMFNYKNIETFENIHEPLVNAAAQAAAAKAAAQAAAAKAAAQAAAAKAAVQAAAAKAAAEAAAKANAAKAAAAKAGLGPPAAPAVQPAAPKVAAQPAPAPPKQIQIPTPTRTPTQTPTQTPTPSPSSTPTPTPQSYLTYLNWLSGVKNIMGVANDAYVSNTKPDTTAAPSNNKSGTVQAQGQGQAQGTGAASNIPLNSAKGPAAPAAGSKSWTDPGNVDGRNSKIIDEKGTWIDASGNKQIGFFDETNGKYYVIDARGNKNLYSGPTDPGTGIPLTPDFWDGLDSGDKGMSTDDPRKMFLAYIQIIERKIDDFNHDQAQFIANGLQQSLPISVNTILNENTNVLLVTDVSKLKQGFLVREMVYQ